MNRKKFIQNAAGLWALTSLSPRSVYASSNDPEPLSPSLVKEFVVAGHKNLDKVKELLAEYPNLIYARHDWGNGDFEEAIEGAGHLGNQEIANYLITQGARVNLFVMTMLGQMDLVKPILEAYPALIQAKGPHGFTLLHHAKVGGKNAAPLYDYLQEKGLAKTFIKLK